MHANKLAVLLLAFTLADAFAQDAGKQLPGLPAAAPPTIGQLAAEARQRRMAEESGVKSSAPPGMTIVPSTQIIANPGLPAAGATVSAASKKEKKKASPEFVPSVLSVFRIGKKRFVELADLQGGARYEAGQVTPSGWTIFSIDDHVIDLGKSDPKTKKQRHLQLAVVSG
jgi:hypothetical protein